MAHAHSTFRVSISHGLRITHAVAFALSHAVNVTVILVSSLRALYVRIHTSVTYHIELLYSSDGLCFICTDLYDSWPSSDPRTTSDIGCDSLRHRRTGTCDLYQPQSQLGCTLLRHNEKIFLKPL